MEVEGFLELFHLPDHISSSPGAPVPQSYQRVARMRHLPVAPEARRAPVTLPVRWHHANRDLVGSGPRLSKFIDAPRVAGDHFGDQKFAVSNSFVEFVWIQNRTGTGDNDAHVYTVC